MKINVLRQHSRNAPLLAKLLGPDYEVRGFEKVEASALDADVLVTISLTPEEASHTRARLVHVPAAGFEGISWDFLPEECLGANVFGHEIPIGEFVIHAALNHVFQVHTPKPLTEANWAPEYFGRAFRGELSGRTMTIVGTGHIGQEVAKRAQGFGVSTVGVNRSGRAAPNFDRIAAIAAFDEVLPETDILVLCCPLNDTTRSMLNRARLAKLSPNALLINVARGEVVEEEALYQSLKSGELGAAALDVWYQYPKSADERLSPSNFPFSDLPNVSMTPHISGWSEGLMPRRYKFIANNVKRFESGSDLRHQIWPHVEGL